MQTFLPIASFDFTESASVLDNKRLNKQALEGWQIMLTLLELDPDGNHRKPKGWVNHPAVKMWRGHEPMLWHYIMSMVHEWKSRGFKSTIGDKATKTIDIAFKHGLTNQGAGAIKGVLGSYPVWMENHDKYNQIAASHRQALLVKNYEWYSQFHWPEDKGVTPTEYDYVWE